MVLPLMMQNVCSLMESLNNKAAVELSDYLTKHIQVFNVFRENSFYRIVCIYMRQY